MKSTIGVIAVLLLGMLRLVVPAGAASSAEATRLFDASMRFSDGCWDEKVGLIHSPAPGESGLHRVRESAWYALGLLMRDQPGDNARAVRIIEQVLDAQFDAPGQRWDGTYHRAPEESVPTPGAELWRNYDPNWREFIGTTFALILENFETRLPAGLPARLEDSIRRAVEGELTQGRAEPYHTNIKLMHGFLWSWAGKRLHRPEWIRCGEQWAENVAAEFAVNETFDEYNSPTYYGVDLYGLALWRKYGATEKIRTLGAKLEAGLWRDIGRFYHAGLKNLCGPFDRAYGMDMRRYVSLTGAWMGMVLPAGLAPLPDPSGPMDHAHDFVVMPLYVLLGARVPDEVLESFRAFQGERVLRRPITTSRIATAWLSDRVMIGGEITGRTIGANPTSGQFHPATIHWQVQDRDLGWMKLYASPPCDAEAGKHTLTITSTVAGDYVFRLSVPGLASENFLRERWTLPGLGVAIATDAHDFAVTVGNGIVDVRYSGATRLEFHTAAITK